MPRYSLVVVAFLSVVGVVRPADPDALLVRTANQPFATLRTETLANGLRVYLLPVPGAATVTTEVAYRVGSADEEAGQTGLSHYLEHLLFKGTDKLVPGDIDRLTQRNGGRNNAYTSEDMTVYHFDFAADRWTTALEIEADRMRNTRIDAKHEFEQEKGAVIAELKAGEDRPWELEYKTILPMLFPKGSPYAHPVIGEEDHVRAATAEIIRRHYDRWYHPNNAAIVVAGGFDPDEAMTKIEALFGTIPKGDLPAHAAAPAQPERAKQLRRVIPSKFDVPLMTVGFNIVPAGHPDDYVFDLIQTVLAGGETSRLYQKLVTDERLADDVGAWNNAGRYPGWFEIDVEMLKGKNRQRAEAMVFAELARLAREPVPEAEWNRARRALVAGLIFGRESVHDLADEIAEAVTRNDVTYATTYLDRVLAVTPADVQRVAGKYLTEDKAVVVWSVPDGDTSAITPGAPPVRASTRHRDRDSTPPAAAVSLADAKRVVLPNGLTLLLLENHRLPIVVAQAEVNHVRLREPADKAGVAAFVGELLDEGTATRTGEQTATLIDDTGGSLVFDSTGGTLRVLTPDTELGLELLLDGLIRPAFPVAAVERKRAQLLSDIADDETQPRNRARNTFHELVYGPHPFGRPALGRSDTVKHLTAADLRAFHETIYTPDATTIAVVGDFDTRAMIATIARLTADWKSTGLPKPTPPVPPTASKPVERIISDPTAAQTHVYIGHLGITRDNPDYYTLLVLDNILGTGPGFTDRLSATLRDRQGLAYTVTAQITGSADQQRGTFIGYIGTFPDKYTWVRDGFIREIRRIRDEPATAAEVDSAKQYLLGSLPFRLETNEQIADLLIEAERAGLGFDGADKLRAGVSRVTAADVQAAALKYLDPKKLVIVAVGPIDTDGRPLTE